MSASRPLALHPCNCLALRKASRHVTQLYDHCLAPVGLRTTQFGILAHLQRLGPMSINALAAELVLDRTTMGRNILPLERDGLIAIAPSEADRRVKELRLTRAGERRFEAALPHWSEAQRRFERTYGAQEAAALRDMLGSVVESEFGAPSAVAGD